MRFLKHFIRALLFLMILVFPVVCYALDANELTGKWQGDDNKEYEFVVNGNSVRVIIPTEGDPDSEGNAVQTTRHYTGTFNEQSFTVTYRPRAVTDFSSELPNDVRTRILRNYPNYNYRANVEVVSPQEIRLTIITDTVTYGRDDHQISRINPNDSQRVVTLKVPVTYTIGQIKDNDDTPRQRRINARISQLQREIERIQQRTLPGLESTADSLSRTHTERLARLDEARQQMDVASVEIQAMNRQITELREEAANILAQVPRAFMDTHRMITQDIARMEGLIIQINELPERDPARGRLPRLFEELEQRRTELAQINARIEQEGPVTRLRELANEKAGQIRELIAIRDQRMREVTQRTNDLAPLTQQLTDKLTEIEDQREEIRSKERQIAYYQLKPGITEITMDDQHGEKFKATSQLDERVLSTYLEDLSNLDQELNGILEQLPESRRILEEVSRKRGEFREEMRTAGEEAVAATDYLSETIWENALIKFWVELVSSGVQIAASGGPLGAIAELGNKMIEYYAINGSNMEVGIYGLGSANLREGRNHNSVIQSFDESAMREQYRQLGQSGDQPAGPGLLDGLDQNGVSTEALKALVTATQETGVNLTRNAATNRAERLIAENLVKQGMNGLEDSSLRRLQESLQEAQGAMERAADWERRTAHAYRQAGRQNLGAQVSDRAYNAWREAQQRSMEARRAFTNQNSQLAKRMTAWGRSQSSRALTAAERTASLRDSLGKVNQGRTKLNELKAQNWRSMANLKRVGLAVGADIALDAVKGLISNYLDQQEAEAWREHFRKDLVLKVAVKNLMETSYIYWQAFDHHRQLLSDYDTLRALRLKTDQMRNAYVAGGGEDTGGYYVEMNEKFKLEDAPLRFSVKVVGPGIGEEVYLENPSSEYKHVQAQRTQTSMDAGNDGSAPANPEGYNPQLDEHLNEYNLPSLQPIEPPPEGGALPLKIRLL